MDPTGEFTGKFAANMLIELFKEGLKGLGSFDTWVRGKTKAYDPLKHSIGAYSEKMFRRYNQMQIFGQSKPKPLSWTKKYIFLSLRMTFVIIS